jgi:hypothetical protein
MNTKALEALDYIDQHCICTCGGKRCEGQKDVETIKTALGGVVDVDAKQIQKAIYGEDDSMSTCLTRKETIEKVIEYFQQSGLIRTQPPAGEK